MEIDPANGIIRYFVRWMGKMIMNRKERIYDQANARTNKQTNEQNRNNWRENEFVQENNCCFNVLNLVKILNSWLLSKEISDCNGYVQ